LHPGVSEAGADAALPAGGGDADGLVDERVHLVGSGDTLNRHVTVETLGEQPIRPSHVVPVLAREAGERVLERPVGECESPVGAGAAVETGRREEEAAGQAAEQLVTHRQVVDHDVVHVVVFQRPTQVIAHRLPGRLASVGDQAAVDDVQATKARRRK
jgi:hypothetical protein